MNYDDFQIETLRQIVIMIAAAGTDGWWLVACLLLGLLFVDVGKAFLKYLWIVPVINVTYTWQTFAFICPFEFIRRHVLLFCHHSTKFVTNKYYFALSCIRFLGATTTACGVSLVVVDVDVACHLANVERVAFDIE